MGIFHKFCVFPLAFCTEKIGDVKIKMIFTSPSIKFGHYKAKEKIHTYVCLFYDSSFFMRGRSDRVILSYAPFFLSSGCGSSPIIVIDF